MRQPQPVMRILRLLQFANPVLLPSVRHVDSRQAALSQIFATIKFVFRALLFSHLLTEVTTKGGNPTNLKSTTRPVAVSIAYLEQNSIQPKPDADARFGWTACIAKNEVISGHGAIDIERVRCR